MGKLNLYLLVGSGMWLAFNMAAFIFTIPRNFDPLYELSRLVGPFVWSVPVFLYSYWRFNDKKKKEIKLA